MDVVFLASSAALLLACQGPGAAQDRPEGAPPVPAPLPRRDSPSHPFVEPGFAVVRPRDAADASSLGFTGTPRTVVIALEHPMLPPPELTRQRLGERDLLVLSWLAKAPGQALTAQADRAYAWAVDDEVALLAVRVVPRQEDLAAPLSPATDVAPATVTATISSAAGPDVLLSPGYWRFDTAWIFGGRYAAAPPAGVGEGAAVAVVRPTATGRRARLLGVQRLEGGVRVALALPVDRGPTPWGPRGGDERDVLAVPAAGERVEWLLTLE